MGDEFNISTVNNLEVNNIQEVELSDISTIIKEMISIKNKSCVLIKKRNRPYDIVDKIELNKISKNLAAKVKKYHIESYDLVDDAISCLSELDACMREDLYDYYWDIYIDVLTELEIEIDNSNFIKEKADDIYLGIMEKINKQIFLGKKTDIPYNRRVTYIGAITSYVFYKCKFLIPI